MASNFHIELFVLLGYPCTPYSGDYRWLGEIPSVELLTQVESLPDNEAEFLGVDMTAFPAALQTYQCARIRALRSAAYSAEADGLYFGAQGDGDVLDEWRAKRDEIKERYPWPAEYR